MHHIITVYQNSASSGKGLKRRKTGEVKAAAQITEKLPDFCHIKVDILLSLNKYTTYQDPKFLINSFGNILCTRL